MAIASTDVESTSSGLTKARILQIMLLTAVILTAARPILPEFLVRLPESWIPPMALWMDAIFNFVIEDLKLAVFTRWIAEGPLEFMLDTTANLLFGKRRWPYFEPIPWTAIAAAATVLGYYLGGWRMALLAGGTFVWTALIGQWKIAMQTMSVLVVAAPMAFFIGLLLGISRLEMGLGRTCDETDPVGVANSAILYLPFARGHLFQGGPDSGGRSHDHICHSANDSDDHAGAEKSLARSGRGRQNGGL